MRRVCTGAVALGLAVAGCGGGTPAAATGAGAAAQRFVDAVGAGHRTSWCAQLGSPLFSSSPSGALNGQALQSCVSGDVFALTGSCDHERALAGATVTAVSSHGASATAKLSSGVSLVLHQVAGQWLVGGVGGRPTSSHAPATGPCAKA